MTPSPLPIPPTEAANSDFVSFCQRVLKDIEHGGRRLVLAEIHIAIAMHIDYAWARNMDALINAPMGHGKSTIVGVGLPAYLLGKNPSNRIKIISATDPLARDRVNLIRQYIRHDPDYRAVFPNVKPANQDMWTQSKLYVARQGMSPDASLESRGVLATGVGGRCDYLLFDDPEDQRNSRSSIKREAVRAAYTSTWKTRLEPWGRMAMIGTPYHMDGLNFYVRSRETTCTLSMAIDDGYAGVDFEVLNAPDDQHPLMLMRAA